MFQKFEQMPTDSLDQSAEQTEQKEEKSNQELSTGSSAVKTEAEIAIDIVKGILAEKTALGENFDSHKVYQETQEILQGISRTKSNIAESQKAILHNSLIRGGYEALETMLRDIERESTISEAEKMLRRTELLENYAHSRIIEKARVVELETLLMNKFLDPYAKVKDCAKLTNSKPDQNGEWKTDNSWMRGFNISPKAENEICAGIETALRIKQNNEELLARHRHYDGQPDANAIIKEVYGYQAKYQAEMLSEGPLAITIQVFSDDFNEINTESKGAGGVHRQVLGSRNQRAFGDRSKQAKFSRGGYSINFYLAQIMPGEMKNRIISHENEHAANELFFLNRGQKSGDMEKSIPSLLKQIETSPEMADRIVDRIFEEFLLEADNRRVANFADELMAYMLNNLHAYNSVESNVSFCVNFLLTNNLYEHLHLSTSVIDEIKKDFSSRVDKMMDRLIGSGLFTETVDKIYGPLRPKIEKRLTLDGMKESYESIARGIAILVKRYPKRKNYIRALLAGENPLKWERIALAEESYARTIEQNKEQVKKQSEYNLQHQLQAARTFLALIDEENFPEEDNKKDESTVVDKFERGDQRVIFSGDQYGVKGKNLVRDIFQNDRQFLLNVKNNPHSDESVIIDSAGKKIFHHKLHKISNIIDAGGKIAFMARLTNQVFDKKVIVAQGRKEAIGNEYLEVADPVYYQGKIIFQARKDNGLWQIIDENNQPLSDEQKNIKNFKVIGDRFFYEVYRNGKDQIIDNSRKMITKEEYWEIKKTAEIKPVSDTVEVKNNEVYLNGETKIAVGKEISPVDSSSSLPAKYFELTTEDDKKYLIDKQGRKLIEITDQRISHHFEDNQDYFYVENTNSKFSLFNHQGEEVVKDCEEILGVHDGCVFLRQGANIIRQKL